MPGSEDDLGLDLRLPWGRPDRLPNASRSESSSSPPAPPASAQPDVVAAIDELRRDVKGLVSAVETRLDQLERRLSQVAAALPMLLTQIEADLVSQQSATVKAVGELQNVPLVDRLERRIDGAALDITGRLERLEALVQPQAGSSAAALSQAVLKLRQRPPAHTDPATKRSDPG